VESKAEFSTLRKSDSLKYFSVSTVTFEIKIPGQIGSIQLNIKEFY